MRATRWQGFLAACVLLAPPVAWIARVAFGLRLELHGARELLWALVAAPVLEEFVFRRVFQHGLRRLAIGVGTRNLVTASVFALCHLPTAGRWCFLWIVPSLALGHVWERSGGRLLPCILLHAWFNTSLWMVSR